MRKDPVRPLVTKKKPQHYPRPALRRMGRLEPKEFVFRDRKNRNILHLVRIDTAGRIKGSKALSRRGLSTELRRRVEKQAEKEIKAVRDNTQRRARVLRELDEARRLGGKSVPLGEAWMNDWEKMVGADVRLFPALEPHTSRTFIEDVYFGIAMNRAKRHNTTLASEALWLVEDFKRPGLGEEEWKEAGEKKKKTGTNNE